MNIWQQDKGQRKCVMSFLDAVSSKSQLNIKPSHIFEVSKVCLDISN